MTEVRTLGAELRWLILKNGSSTPESLLDYDLASPREITRLIQQRSDRVVQLNSALSYVISQAFFGAPPVLASTSMLRRHSLLGVGRAHRAVRNQVRQIEDAFRRLCVAKSIYEKWSAYPRLPGFDSDAVCDGCQWKVLELPDILLASPADSDPWKITYFSGRLGYRESEYSVSAAIQAVTSGDDADWSLATMTHEMLHGHVRDLLHAVFDRVREDDPQRGDEFWAVLFARFRSHMKGEATDDLRLIDSVRHVMLSYCCLVSSMGSLTRLPAVPKPGDEGEILGKFRVPRDDLGLLRLLEEENRNISEIMVHTLDLFYFYFDNFDRYNRCVWGSWRTVPAVLRDVRQYALRMMLAFTSMDDGEPIGRFARARNRVRASLIELSKELGGDPVLDDAVAILALADGPTPETTRNANHPLFQPFLASVRIADLARHCFASARVRAGLFGDDVVKAVNDDSEIDFGIQPGEFSDHEVRSVAEFIAWRARSGHAGGSPADVERLTAWLFLACGNLPGEVQE